MQCLQCFYLFVCLFSGWSLGEHQEWSKYSNFEVSVNAPLMFYIPGVTAFKEHKSERFPYVSPLNNRDHEKKNSEDQFLSKDSPLFGKSLLTRNIRKYNTTAEFAEFVDIFPTLSDLASLPSLPLCPINSSNVKLCTEGTSLVPVIFSNIYNQSASIKWKSATFSQYPRPSDFPTEISDQPKLTDIKIVGYSMRSKTSRYTEWIGFDPVLFRANWSDIHARELYLYENDPLEMNNVAGFKKYSKLVNFLSQKLRSGWRNALPQRSEYILDFY